MIRTALEDRVLTVTIDRPSKRNALTVAMRQELEALPARINGDESVGVVVVRGEPGCFSAGADLDEIRSLDSVPSTRPAEGIAAIEVPTIAFVDGMCVTGGLELALACDLIVGTARARFKDTHAAMGVVPRWGMTARLPDRIGAGRAAELMLSARWVDAQEAYEWRLLDRLVESDADVAALANSIASTPVAAARAVLALLRPDRTEALRSETETAASFGLS